MTDTEEMQERSDAPAPPGAGSKAAKAAKPAPVGGQDGEATAAAAEPAKSGSDDGPATEEEASASALAPELQEPAEQPRRTDEANAEEPADPANETAAGGNDVSLGKKDGVEAIATTAAAATNAGGNDGGVPGKEDGEENTKPGKPATSDTGSSQPTPLPSAPANGTKRKETDDKQKLPTKPPKKARTAYFMFADEKRAEVQAAHPGETVGVIAKHIGQMWGGLSPEDKKAYQDRAAEEKLRVAKEMDALREAGLLPDPATASSGGASAGPSAGFVLPVARIRKICKLDPEVRGLSKEGVVLITKAAELFTAKLGREVVAVAAMQNRRKILPEDVGEVCSTKEEFRFLREDVKDLMQEQKEAQKERAAGDAKSKKADAGMSGIQPLTSFFGASTSTSAPAPKET